jgi:Alr-MurF fusion protein
MKLNLQEIATVLKAKVVTNNIFVEIDHVSIDSRSMTNNSNTLFFAIEGANNNGHQFINQLIKNGVQNFVVTYIPNDLAELGNFLIVENTLKSLQNLAAFYRKQFQFPIIGITGSNGKTIVKEWLSFLLAPDFNVVKSPKSYNSQVGVPLSIFTINNHHNLGIFEAGISTTNEMQNLQQMILPNIGILTNIGSAHDEGFENLAQKIKEKLKLFSNVEVLIYNKNKTITSFLNPETETFSWSSHDKTVDVFLQKKSVKNQSILNTTYKNECFSVRIPFTDDASIENCMQCLTTMLYLNIDIEKIQARMLQLFPVEMRLKLKNGINNTTIIDDSYSADFQSLKIALDFLESQKKHKKKTLILSDIFQSALEDSDLYAKVSQLILANKINNVIVIGETISRYKSKFVNVKAFSSTADFLLRANQILFANETILVKGARSFEFEKIVAFLEEKTHETVLEINLNAISHNLSYYKAKLEKNVKLMVMVKAFGYGNGGAEIAQLLQHHNIDYLGVAFADEGISLRQSGIHIPIMVLNPENSSFLSIVQHQLEPEIYSFKGLEAFLKIAEQQNLNQYPIHIKIDTGMHRLGFQEIHLEKLVEVLSKNKFVTIKSILSHLATSDDLESTGFANQQIELFKTTSSFLINNLKINPILHILNSSGISNFSNAQFNMVRLGIGLYGISNNPAEQVFLENVGTLKSVISQIKNINVGESVGYSRRFIAAKPSKIATIPIGYADGISRKLGNGVGFVVINNKKAAIIGSVCMDMLMVDVSEIECVEGDSVIIFGENPTVADLAKMLETISYEILTGISQRVKRIFYRA